LERAWGFPDKGLLAALQGSMRPAEIPWFMRYARRQWEGTVPMVGKGGVGPRERKDSLSQRWWKWWELMQPEERKDGGKEVLRGKAWEVLAKTHGRNGLLLVIGCLLWWGDAAKAACDAALWEDWMLAVRDFKWVLSQVLDGVEDLYVRLPVHQFTR
ncbi:hypothetical protein B0H15DRAFT_791929, partial [Mycena belliarum]